MTSKWAWPSTLTRAGLGLLATGQIAHLLPTGLGVGEWLMVSVAIGIAVGALFVAWECRLGIAYYMLHGTWLVLSTLDRYRRRAITCWRRCRNGDPPRGVYLHLSNGRDVPMTPVFTGTAPDGTRIWTLVHDGEVRLVPEELRGVQVKGDYLPTGADLVIHPAPVDTRADIYRFSSH